MLLFGKDKLNVTIADLPCLIHGGAGSGASLFSISLLAEQFCLQGKKILFLALRQWHETSSLHKRIRQPITK